MPTNSPVMACERMSAKTLQYSAVIRGGVLCEFMADSFQDGFGTELLSRVHVRATGQGACATALYAGEFLLEQRVLRELIRQPLDQLLRLFRLLLAKRHENQKDPRVRAV